MSEYQDIRILVLDDGLLVLKVHAQMLAHLGFTAVRTARSGAEALALLDGGAWIPDLILLDLAMPGMDGLEFIRRLVERQFEGRLLLVSGEDERVLRTVEKLAAAHKVRVLGILPKPVQQDQLAVMLHRYRPPSSTFEIAWRRTYPVDAIREAIDAGHITVHYEPKVAVATGAFEGVEALARWNHPKDGLILPQQFVPVAETGGLIGSITRIVFSKAIAQMAQWKSVGLSVRMAVNVSVDALSDLHFADFAYEQVTKAGVAARDVTLEITESRLMQDLRVPLEVLMRLHLMRFELSIDDFGTGYSSLTQLQDIPFSELKVDRSFVHRGGQDQTVQTMYATCLGLARQLRMRAVAEGVETQEDWQFVRKSECDLAQGYFIGRAMPPEAIMGWRTRWQERVKANFPEQD